MPRSSAAEDTWCVRIFYRCRLFFSSDYSNLYRLYSIWKLFFTYATEVMQVCFVTFTKQQQWFRVVQTAVLARTLLLIAYFFCRGRNPAAPQILCEKLNSGSRRAHLLPVSPARTCTARIPLTVCASEHCYLTEKHIPIVSVDSR